MESVSGEHTLKQEEAVHLCFHKGGGRAYQNTRLLVTELIRGSGVANPGQ